MIIGPSRIRGFLGIGSTEFNYNRKGITQVVGDNQDSNVSDSNGAGKSSLFEVPFWALYGQTRRGLRGDDVVNRHDRGGCSIVQEIEMGGKPYTIVRTRKDKVYGSSLKLYGNCRAGDVNPKKDEVPKHAVDMTRGTVRDTQEAIDELVGIGPLSFSKMVFFGQGDVKPFASLTDSELKMVFEQALGLGYFSHNKVLVNGYAKSIKDRLAELDSNQVLEEGRLKLANDRLEVKRRQIADTRDQQTKWRKNLQEEIDHITKEVAELRDEESNLKSERVSRQAQKEALTEQVYKLKEMKAKLQTAFTTATREQANNDAGIAAVRKALADCQAEQTRMTQMSGRTCVTCKQVVAPSMVADQLIVLDTAVHSEQTALRDAMLKAADIETKVVKVQELTWPVDEQLEKMMVESNQVAARLTNIDLMLTQHASSIGFKNGQLDKKQVELAGDQQLQQDKVDALQREYDLIFAEARMSESALTRIELQKKENGDNLQMAEELAGALGNAGVKSYIFDAVTPELNRVANTYSQILDPDIGVEVSTVTKLKSGDYREKFSVSVTNQVGANSLAGSSGGEKQKVNLAIALAFNRLMRSMAGSDVPMIVLDEPFEALDAGSSDQVIELISELDAENLFVITHNESVRNLIPDRVTMTKKHGKSTIQY